MLKRFLQEYNEKLSLEIRNNIKPLRSLESEILERFGGNLSNVGGIITLVINSYKDELIKLSDISCNLLKNMLNENKVNKIRKTKTINKIKEIILGKFDGTLREIEQSSIPQLLATLDGNIPTGLKISAQISAKGLASIRNDTEKKIEIIINDYNKNPQNFWGRNKDKLIVPIILFIITTILLILTKSVGCS